MPLALKLFKNCINPFWLCILSFNKEINSFFLSSLNFSGSVMMNLAKSSAFFLPSNIIIFSSFSILYLISFFLSSFINVLILSSSNFSTNASIFKLSLLSFLSFFFFLFFKSSSIDSFSLLIDKNLKEYKLSFNIVLIVFASLYGLTYPY